VKEMKDGLGSFRPKTKEEITSEVLKVEKYAQEIVGSSEIFNRQGGGGGVPVYKRWYEDKPNCRASLLGPRETVRQAESVKRKPYTKEEDFEHPIGSDRGFFVRPKTPGRFPQ